MESHPQRKVLFLALAFCMVFSVVFAEALLADEIDHNCTGEGCPFCLAIETVHNFVKNLKLVALAVFLAVCPALLIHTLKKRAEFALSLNSPLALKVRLIS